MIEKKIEHSQMLEDMTADLDAVTRECQVYVGGLGRAAAQLAEDCHHQEFRRALRYMDTAEVVAAY